MRLLFTNVLLSLLVGAAIARPRFIAIPLDDVQLVQMSHGPDHRFQAIPLTRLPRRASPVPAPGPDSQKVDASTNRQERHTPSHDRHDFVDFGAHTGHHGSFGWYADFPAYKDK